MKEVLHNTRELLKDLIKTQDNYQMHCDREEAYKTRVREVQLNLSIITDQKSDEYCDLSGERDSLNLLLEATQKNRMNVWSKLIAIKRHFENLEFIELPLIKQTIDAYKALSLIGKH